MKLRKELVLRQVAGSWIVVPVGQASVDLNGVMNLNDSAVVLWKALEGGADRDGLVAALTGEYQVGQDQAAQDVDAFLAVLHKAGFLE